MLSSEDTFRKFEKYSECNIPIPQLGLLGSLKKSSPGKIRKKKTGKFS